MHLEAADNVAASNTNQDPLGGTEDAFSKAIDNFI